MNETTDSGQIASVQQALYSTERVIKMIEEHFDNGKKLPVIEMYNDLMDVKEILISM